MSFSARRIESFHIFYAKDLTEVCNDFYDIFCRKIKGTPTLTSDNVSCKGWDTVPEDIQNKILASKWSRPLLCKRGTMAPQSVELHWKDKVSDANVVMVIGLKYLDASLVLTYFPK